jgi:hypothetical protein
MNDMDRTPSSGQPETQEYRLKWYQARLGFWQAIWGTIITGGVAVAIPAAVEVYKVRAEREKVQQESILKQQEVEIKKLEVQLKQQAEHATYISQFLSQALNQDIELRLRFAEYFSFLSSGDEQKGWTRFRDDLLKKKQDIRTEIDTLEQDYYGASTGDGYDELARATIKRKLDWAYREIGYVAPNIVIRSNSDLSETVREIPSDRLWQLYDEQQAIDLPSANELMEFHAQPVAISSVGLDCVEPENPEFLGMLRTDFINRPSNRFRMLQFAFARLKSDLDELKALNSELFDRLYFESALCVRRAKREQPTLVPDSYGISVMIYLVSADKDSEDIRNWDEGKVSSYEELVRFMNQHGWRWSSSVGKAGQRFYSKFTASAKVWNEL